MTFLEKLKHDIASELKLNEKLFIYPPESRLGDLSFPCFILAKEKKVSPVELAFSLAQKALANENFKLMFSKIEAAGPYLNFFIKNNYLAPQVLTEIKKTKSDYGLTKKTAAKKIMIEYSNGNTHKEYHVGHLRNISYGEAVKNLLASQGNKVIPVSYINDFGIHTAKTIWNWRLNPVYEERPEAKGFLLGKCYSEASKKLNDKPELKEEVAEVMKNIEKRSGVDYELWQKTRTWSISYFNDIYKELGIKFKEIFYESEVINEGLKIVDKLLEQGVLQPSQGAIIADLNDYDLGVLPVIRSDGTALYPVADLALASEKFKKYNLDSSIYIVDVRQSQYFKQLFKVLELAGYKQPLIHLSYDFVTLPEGMMASRTGNVITYEDLKTKLFDKLLLETAKRHQDWTDSRREKVASSLTISTIKFEMLKVGAEKTITFNLDEASRSEGFTACYVLYGYARLRSIMRKSGFNFSFSTINSKLLEDPREKEILLKLAKYPEILQLAAEKYNPGDLIKYLFELVQMFNDYYHNCNILKAEKELKLVRLNLLKSLSQVLINGFKIIGLEPLEEM
ncbi:arginine--tRNA ligase [Patescibacteria group bacterium]|nr:arginine--tRNA ligase [Patescibacteria group bacterium]